VAAVADKLTLATAWLSGCAGCHVSILDTHEALLDVVGRYDLVWSPLVDAKELPEKVDVAVIEGAVANAHDLALVTSLRDRAATVVALGTCATYGGITGMRNLMSEKQARAAVYPDTGNALPGDSPNGVPLLERRVRSVPQVIQVEHEIPGCPPRPDTVAEALMGLADGVVPEYPRHNLCHECERKKDKMLVSRREFITDNVYAPFELEAIDEKMCFLEQGVICMGPLTREGCGTQCVNVNMPCRGCWGPAVEGMEQGAKLIDALAPVLPAGAMMYLDDLVGTGYRYSLASSILGGADIDGEEGGDE
jgi:F420-non-reducing hydrogenase small subunit